MSNESVVITEKEIKKVKISHDLKAVTISLERITLMENDEEEDGYKKVNNDHDITGRYRPHKDFVDAMKKLRKFALDICEIEVDSKSMPDWSVCEINISGDMTTKKSRVTMVLAKKINWTGKVLEFKKLPQITMYPEKDDRDRYHDAEKLTAAIEIVIEEAWKYLNGKFELEDNPQLALFPTVEVQHA